ncbi:MAG: translation initiation factor IF-2, partial [Bdellovibrionota bacterium]
INKIDKPGANPEKIKQSLAELNLLSEDWGGETMFIQVSALKKTNIDKLLDAILLQAEMLELKANPGALAIGTVLEARLEKGRGPVVSLLISKGTLKVGDPLVAGQEAGKIKALTNDKGQQVKS